MPKKEEILEKNDKLKKEKISSQKNVKETPKKAKVENKTKNEISSKKTTSKKSADKKNANKTADTKTKTEKTTGVSKKQTEAKPTVKKDNSKKITTKNETKKTSTKESSKKEKTKKETAKKETKPVLDKKTEKEIKKAEVKEEKKIQKKAESKVDELSVIEKIKSFIAKIAAMQEEARKEAQAEKEIEEVKEEKVSKVVKKSKAKEEKEVKKFEYLVEYYDLPYRYNETVVKILVQTPKRMFVYWDISDNDREKYIKTFGEDFFEKTYPVLLLYNEDKKYIKEIAINDFANSWYIDIPDPKTKYSIQLGRKFKEYNEVVKVNMQKVQENNIILHTDYLPLANSNVLEVPNDRVLIDSLPRFITFRNVITKEERVVELKDIKNTFGKTYDVKEFYEEHYKDEVSEGLFDMANPSSKLSSSSFK